MFLFIILCFETQNWLDIKVGFNATLFQNKEIYFIWL